MFWIYMIIYFLGAIITGLIVYVFHIKEYKRIKTSLKFRYWIEHILEIIFFLSLFWVIALPIWVIVCFIKAIIKKINKHYNID